VDTHGKITTIAGTGTAGFSGDGGPALQAAFNLPHELRFGPDGNLYVADTGNNVIRRIDLKTRIVTTYAGSKKRGYTGDGGPAAQATFNGPHSLQFSPAGDLFVCDVGNHAIRRIDSKTGTIETVAGTGKPGPTPDGAPIRGTPLNSPRSLDVDAQGDLWIVTREGNQVFKLDLREGRIHHLAGTGTAGFTGNGGPAKAAQLSGPKGIALDAAGDVWLADTESHTIRVIHTKTGLIDVVAGTGSKGDGPDGPPLKCSMNRPHGVFADKDGSIFIGDSEAHRIRLLRLN
jgi:streptogramin lyase